MFFYHEQLVLHWYLVIFFNHKKAELLYRVKIKEELETPRKNSYWEDQNDYVPEHFIFIKNMMASIENNELSVHKNPKKISTILGVDKMFSSNKVLYDYNVFFKEHDLPGNPIQKLSDIHLLRSKGRKKIPKEKDPTEPFLTVLDAVFPAEILAWYRLAKNSNPELDYSDPFVKPYIDFEYKKEIQNPDLLEIAKLLSDFVGEDVLLLGLDD